MCGIFGYTGTKDVGEMLIEGIKTLEYRGYDSAGIYIDGHNPLRAVGEVVHVEDLFQKEKQKGESGIAHTRWATHGEPELKNTHPHTSCDEKIHLVHNGIIENYQQLREDLEQKGHSFYSDTDTETLVHLIEETYKSENDLKQAVIAALKKVEGTYGVAVMHRDEPDTIIVGRMGSPIVLGIGENSTYVASDPSAILRHTKQMVYLEDGECAKLHKDTYEIFSLKNKVIEKSPEEIQQDVEEIQKEGYEHFMLKEIMEAPSVVESTTRGRLDIANGTAHLGGLQDVATELQKAKRIIIVACGSAYYAGLVGKYFIEEYADVPVDVAVASEFRYKTTPHEDGTVLLAVSQSGETADTLACIKEAKRKGTLALGIINAIGSTIARETDAGVYNHAGPEISVASTKAFISQITVLYLLGIFLGRQRNMSVEEGKKLITELKSIPKKISAILDSADDIRVFAEKYADYKDFLYIGRKYNFAMAYEGALKLKEVSYIHAEGYGAGEMKHGPLAMIDEDFPTVAILPNDSVYEKNVSNIEEIRARKGKVLSILSEGDTRGKELSTDSIEIPNTIEPFTPLLTAVPLQLLGYYISLAKGFNVDRPRNLAKAVTVE